MKYRQLGKTGPRVSAIGMGRGSQPVRSGEALEPEFNAAIHRALDLGINLFDSSDAYWGARHEVLLGRALQGRREQAQIITKFGNIDLPDGKKATNGRPEYIYQCCDASLARLGVGVHVTAPTIHAGFGYKPGATGYPGNPIQLEIWNAGPLDVRLAPGMPVCQLILEWVDAGSARVGLPIVLDPPSPVIAESFGAPDGPQWGKSAGDIVVSGEPPSEARLA